MPTTVQLNANRANTQKGTGPLSDAGKAASSRNRPTLGLHTQRDYLTFDERELYTEFPAPSPSDLSMDQFMTRRKPSPEMCRTIDAALETRRLTEEAEKAEAAAAEERAEAEAQESQTQTVSSPRLHT
jgi:hypothetical protein